MKIIKYVSFITLFITIFVIIYKQSSESQRFQKLKRSFEEAIIIALVLTGFDSKAYEEKVRNNQQ